ncbi:MAG TPA: AIR synthase-related protein [Tepidisphaeraceae bacterium]|jgi:phosphoribosylformylglycinamidine cyclo-ligase|nr:AIR synthase-related protein [Tepidisphaeraceae bacterium]
MSGMSYQSVGVDYDPLDAFKRACQRAAATTASALASHGLSEPAAIRGESAYLIEADDYYLAHVEEGLGTKNLIADAMLKLTGESFYRNIGIDTVATIVNDLATVGALPISVAMHAAVGDANWFEDDRRADELAAGFAEGCRQANAVWGGGETPALKGIVDPSTIVLAGSAIGRIEPKSNRIAGDVEDGDAIVFLASSGVQTNGLTLCRALADKLPEGYLTKMDDGRTYGEALLDPSVIYVKFVAALQAAGIDAHYLAHVTGHGWRKLMRLDAPFVYRIAKVPQPHPVFNFIMNRGPVDVREAYATFNMGIGFAAYVSQADADKTVRVATENGYDAWVAGTVSKQGDRKAVEIEPLGITFEGDTLKVR